MRKLRILVAEDHAITRKNISRVLQLEGFDVVMAATGKEAIRLFTTDFDLVLTDVLMPEMEGSELITHIKQIAPHVPVIVMTAMGTEELVREMEMRGATDFIVKPVDLSALIARIRAVLPTTREA
jgi:DNA-binding response OmpR family regulator